MVSQRVRFCYVGPYHKFRSGKAGQTATVVRELGPDEKWGDESDRMFVIQFADGLCLDASEHELLAEGQ